MWLELKVEQDRRGEQRRNHKRLYRVLEAMIMNEKQLKDLNRKESGVLHTCVLLHREEAEAPESGSRESSWKACVAVQERDESDMYLSGSTQMERSKNTSDMFIKHMTVGEKANK